MKKVAIVILNYLNDKDTVECIASIDYMKYSLCGIVIVDNGSDNGSFDRIKERFKDRKDIFLLRSNKNLGYAKGNNIGITYARIKLGAEYVLVVNNDTLFIQKDYVERLLCAHRKGVAVIGSRVILKNGVQYQANGNHDLGDNFRICINTYTYLHGSGFDIPLKKLQREKILHGCALMFTPDFFRYYSGFYPRTFLYGEENILYLMCKYKGLVQEYVDDAEIFHKEDQSSELSYGNDSFIKQKMEFQSQKYIIWWILKNLVSQKLRIRGQYGKCL